MLNMNYKWTNRNEFYFEIRKYIVVREKRNAFRIDEGKRRMWHAIRQSIKLFSSACVIRGRNSTSFLVWQMLAIAWMTKLPTLGSLPFDLYHRPQSSDSINSQGKIQRFRCYLRPFLIAPDIRTAAGFGCPADSTHGTRICACTAHDGYNTSRNLMNICDIDVPSAVDRATHGRGVSFLYYVRSVHIWSRETAAWTRQNKNDHAQIASIPLLILPWYSSFGLSFHFHLRSYIIPNSVRKSLIDSAGGKFMCVCERI